MEILVGLIPFVVFALIWFGIERFTELTHLGITLFLGIGLVAITAIGLLLAIAYVLGGAILNGVTIA